MRPKGGAGASGPCPQRGEIWRVRLDPTEGSEIRKTRPCVVLTTDALRALPLRTGVPLTGWKLRHEGMWTCVRVHPSRSNGLTKTSAAEADQVRSVTLDRFEQRLGRLDPAQLRDVTDALGMLMEVI